MQLNFDLARAYHLSGYWIILPDGLLLFRPNRTDGALATLLRGHDAGSAALVGAANPYSETRPAAENRRAMASLRADLEDWTVLPAAGGPRGAKPEPSYFVLGIARVMALRLGRRYGQHAIIFIAAPHAVPRLLACRPAQQRLLDRAAL